MYDPPMTVAIMKETTKYWNMVMHENEARDLQEKYAMVKIEADVV